MSDYTVKREKEGILRIQAEGTKMPGPLTINERDYADDKQLIVGGGSSSPLGLAKVRFVTDNFDLSLSEVFSAGPAMWGYLDELSSGRPVLAVDNPNYNISIEGWNAQSETYPKFVAPFLFGMINSVYSNLVTVSSGNAEIVYVEAMNSKVLYVTGDCTINIIAHTR